MGPCPFCGGTSFRVNFTNRFPAMGEDPGPDGWAATVFCECCAAEGPWAKADTQAAAEKAAVRRWNRRVPR